MFYETRTRIPYDSFNEQSFSKTKYLFHVDICEQNKRLQNNTEKIQCTSQT